jgi:ABC-2 type transport system ATP-binding protein
MLELSVVTVRAGRKRLLENISCTVPNGAVVALIGPNGAGKTTLLQTIGKVGVRHTIEGSIESDHGRYPSVAFCPDSQIGFLDLSPEENIDLLLCALDLTPGEHAARREAVVRLLDVDEVLPPRLAHCSLGIRRRVDIMLTMCKNADLYIFDEPYNGLDASWVRHFSRLVTEIADAGRTVVIASHLTDFLLPISDHVFELANGRLTQERTAKRGTLVSGMFHSDENQALYDPPLQWLRCAPASDT